MMMKKLSNHWSVNLVFANLPLGILFAVTAFFASSSLLPNTSATIVKWKFNAPSVPSFHSQYKITDICAVFVDKLIASAPYGSLVTLGYIEGEGITPDQLGILEICGDGRDLSVSYQFDGTTDLAEEQLSTMKIETMAEELTDAVLKREMEFIDSFAQKMNEALVINDSVDVMTNNTGILQQQRWIAQMKLLDAHARFDFLEKNNLNLRFRREVTNRNSNSLKSGLTVLMFLSGFLLSMLIRQILLPIKARKID